MRYTFSLQPVYPPPPPVRILLSYLTQNCSIYKMELVRVEAMCSAPFGHRVHVDFFPASLGDRVPTQVAFVAMEPTHAGVIRHRMETLVVQRVVGGQQPEIIGEMTRRFEVAHVEVGMRWKYVRIASIDKKTLA